MRKQGILLLTIMMILGLTGCWSRVEVNDIGIITATGIDKMRNGEVRVAVQLAVPRLLGPTALGGGGGEEVSIEATWVVAEKGTTVMDAYRRLQEKLPRRLFFSHNRVLIIGEKIAREGVSPILDFVSRQREARLSSYILFAKGEAVDILQFTPKFEKLGSEIIEEEEKLNVMVSKTLREFFYLLIEEGEEPVASQVVIVPSVVNDKEDPQSKQKMNISVNGAAAFQKDKLVGWMNDREARGVLWLRNEMKTAAITVTIPKEKGDGQVSIELFETKTNLKPILQDDKISMEVEVRAKGDIYENTSKLDLSDPKVIPYIEKKIEEDLENRMQLSLDKVQKKFKSDILGFGSSVHREYPSYWRNKLKERWDEEFPKVKVKVFPRVTINRTGLNTKSLMWDEKEFVK